MIDENYLCFTAGTANSTIRMTTTGSPTMSISLQTSVDYGENWEEFEIGTTTITLPNIGDKVYFRGDNPDGFSESLYIYRKFVMSGSISGSGNVMSLVDSSCKTLIIPNSYCFHRLFDGCKSLTSAPELPATTLKNDCYYWMFSGCALTSAPKLPATKLASDCYRYMFNSCTSLKTAPELPATTLETYCYYNMFSNCTSLTSAPELPAKTLATQCYYEMFKGCTSLIIAPELPATTLKNNCYFGMFNGCTNLTSAPELPAKTLKSNCYYQMFYNCKNLTSTPKLPATTLETYCYYQMFYGCTSLTSAPELPATTLKNDCYYQMFYGCTKLKLSTVQTGEYTKSYRIPSTGNGVVAQDSLTDMFANTGGTFTGTPAINTTYYMVPRSRIDLDLSKIGLSIGTYSIQMQLSDDLVTKHDSALSNVLYYTIYSVTGTATNCTINGLSSYSGRLSQGGSIRLTLGADGTNYKLPTSVTVHGATSNFMRSSNTYGMLIISNPTSSVSFSVAGEQARVQLATPDISLSNKIVSWSVIQNAIKYALVVDTSSPIPVANTITSFDLSTLTLAEGDHTVKVMAKGDGQQYLDSEFSDTVIYTNQPPQPVYYGKATDLSEARYYLSSTTVGNHALFGGGYISGGNSAVVDAYNTSLTRSIPTALSTARFSLSATTVGNYALFGGGSGNGYSAVVDAYNTSLTRSTPTALSEARRNLSATTVGNYALFGGGNYTGGSSGYSAVVDAYNTSLTRSIPTVLSVARYYLSATTVGDYALFGGGYSSGYRSNSAVDAYNTSLTRSIPTVLSVARYYLSATTVGDYALFGGGNGSAVVDAYNTSLTRSIPTALSKERSYSSATTVGDYALFGGGYNSSDTRFIYSAVVDAYNTSLTRSIPTALSKERGYISSTTVGNYALFGGGTGDNRSAVVDVYTVQ